MIKILTILTLALILCFVVGCQDTKAINELDKLKTQAELEERNKEIVRHFFDELNKRNYDIYDELCALDFKSHIPSSAEPRNLEDHKKFTIQAYSALTELTQTVVDILGDGDKVVIRTSAHTIHEGELLGIPGTGKELRWTAIAIFHLSDGKIKEIWEEIDAMGLYQQLGMEIKPKQKGK